MISFSPSEVAVYYAARVPKLRHRGKRWRGACLIHGGKNPNFSVDPETGLWRCWSCGRDGDIITLEMELTGAAWRDAVGEIEGLIGRPLLDRPASRTERRAFAGRRQAASSETASIIDWLNGLVPELNADKLAAVHAGNYEALARVASLCNLLENGSPEAVVEEFIRHRASNPADVARLIEMGRARYLESELIAAEAVFLLARAEVSSDAA